MIKDKLIIKIKNELASIITTNNLDVSVELTDQINYRPLTIEKDKIYANIIVGSATKNNDLVERYTQNITMNIFSEKNGGNKAYNLFNLLFKKMTRTTILPSDLNGYSGKITFGSPVLISEYVEVDNGFCNLFAMSGTIEFSKEVIMGCKYELSVNNGSYYTIKPTTPQSVKEAVGGNDTLIGGKTLLSISSYVITHQLTLIAEDNDLFDAILSELTTNVSNTYSLKITRGSKDPKEYTKLKASYLQILYDEKNGNHVISLNLREG